MRSSVSPYRASAKDFISHYCTTPERAELLDGFLAYRECLHAIGIVDGFQWIDGSFIENVEKMRGRPPADIDIVTFARRPSGQHEPSVWAAWVSAHFSACLDTERIRERYSCHSFYIDLDNRPDYLVKDTSYWYGLFSHQRETAQWKGMVEIPLDSDDDVAREILKGVSNG